MKTKINLLIILAVVFVLAPAPGAFADSFLNIFAQQPETQADAETAAITAENTWTAAITPNMFYDRGRQDYGTLILSVSGTFVGTVTLQIAYDSGSTWIDTGETWTEPTTQIITCYEPGVSFRIGIATGGYTSGTCNVRLSK